MNLRHFVVGGLVGSAILRRVNVLVVALVWSSVAFYGCGRSHDEIFHAAYDGDLTKVKTLLKDTPDLLFCTDGNGATLLHYSASYDHMDMTKFFLANKAEVNAKDKKGWTPLHCTASKGHKDMVAFLLSNKADLNAKDNDGRTPLSIAAGNGEKEMVELLLANGADINAKADKGMTPMHVAEEFDQKDVVDLLRKRGGHE